MTKLRHLGIAVAVSVFAASVVDSQALNTISASKAEKNAPADLAKPNLVSLEKSAYQAWKSRDAQFWNAFLSDQFVGWGSSGRLDKASASREYTGADCEIKSYALSNGQMSPRGNEVALLTYKVTVDGMCGGHKIPANSWVAGVYVRDGDSWKAAFHAQAAVIDPRAPAVKTIHNKTPDKEGTKHAVQDSHAETLLAIEKLVWEDWRKHDTQKLAGRMAKEVSFINIFGNYLATKADALKNWSGTGCDVKSVSLTDPAVAMLTPTVGILTFRAAADGTCFGQKVGPVWGSSIYVKEPDGWKWTFGINVPAHPQGT